MEGGKQKKLPAYMLSANKAEIDLLRSNNRIPEGIAYEYLAKGGDYSGAIMVVGARVHIGFDSDHNIVPGNDSPMDGSSTAIPLLIGGSNPFTVQGHAVMVDKSISTGSDLEVIKGKHGEFPINPSSMYFCVHGGETPLYECIDLTKLTVTQ